MSLKRCKNLPPQFSPSVELSGNLNDTRVLTQLKNPVLSMVYFKVLYRAVDFFSHHLCFGWKTLVFEVSESFFLFLDLP